MNKLWIAVGAAVVIAAGVGAALYLLPHAGKVPAAASVAPGPAPAAIEAVAPPADCLLPGPPPVPPNGETSTAADMALGHDVMQAFVLQLEAYQACRNAQIDHAAASVTVKQKEIWLQDGNDAVDEAHMLADAFSVQLKAFKARHPRP